MHTGESKHTRNLYINLACLSGGQYPKNVETMNRSRPICCGKSPQERFQYKNPREQRKNDYLKRNSKMLILLIEKEAQADNYELFKRILLH